jgi:DNA-binding PucR family transcriptional regulator
LALRVAVAAPAEAARGPAGAGRPGVARTLGQLTDAESELRDTLCVYIGEQFSAARALYTDRNTILNRLQRAERLLPFPLAGHGLEVGVALEIAQWLGTPPGSATRDR